MGHLVSAIVEADTQRIIGFLNGMRYINPRFTYLLTYLLTLVIIVILLLLLYHSSNTDDTSGSLLVLTAEENAGSDAVPAVMVGDPYSSRTRRA